MTSTIVLVGRCQPWTPPSPIPTVPSSHAIRTSNQRSHRMVSMRSILVGFAICHLHCAVSRARMMIQRPLDSCAFTIIPTNGTIHQLAVHLRAYLHNSDTLVESLHRGGSA